MSRFSNAPALILVCAALAACGGGSSDSTAVADAGHLTLALTDGPMSMVDQLVVHVEYVELHHSDGRAIRQQPAGGPVDIDLAALQDGRLHDLLNDAELPVGQYRGLSIGINPERSHADFLDGSRHRMQFAFAEGLNVETPFTIGTGQHRDLVIDVDLGQSLHYHQGGMGGGGMGGGGMGGGGDGFYEFHAVTRMLDVENAGGLVGTIDSALVDINHPDCDDGAGGNWAYLFPGGAAEPDDIAQDDTDGRPGPIVTDRVDLHAATGDYRYHFAFVEPGSYRVAFTCSGEWDSATDDDYPSDPDARFDFQAFSAAAEVVAGQVTVLDITAQP